MAFIEMREYTLQPEGHKPYVALSETTGDLRCKVLPFLGAFTTDSGADINRIYHFYYYASFDERDELRGAGASIKAWVDYVTQGRTHTRKQHSSVLQLPGGGQASAAVQAALQLCKQRAEGQCGAPASIPRTAYVLCTYEVPEDAVKQLLGSSSGSSSPAAGQGQLVFQGCKAFGAAVGTVVELWRFASAADALQAQQAGGAMAAWRSTVLPGVQVGQPRAVLLRPTRWSNMQ